MENVPQETRALFGPHPQTSFSGGTPPSPPHKKHLFYVLISVVALALAGAFVFIVYTKSWGITSIFPKQQEEQIERVASVLDPDVIRSIVQLRCFNSAEDKEPTSIGSGLYVGGVDNVVRTAGHVILGDDGKFHGCEVYFPHEDGSFYNSAYLADEATIYNNQESLVNEVKIPGIDYAELYITSPYADPNGISYPFPPAVPATVNELCALERQRENIVIGDEVYILGYPGAGGESLTVEKVIIAGFINRGGENLLKITPTIGPGFSGGPAFGTTDGCLYGFANSIVDDYSTNYSVGYLLSASFINEYAQGFTGKKFELVPTKYYGLIPLERYYNNRLGLSIGYPATWSVDDSEVGDQGTVHFTGDGIAVSLDVYLTEKSLEEEIQSYIDHFAASIRDFEVFSQGDPAPFGCGGYAFLGLGNFDTARGEVLHYILGFTTNQGTYNQGVYNITLFSAMPEDTFDFDGEIVGLMADSLLFVSSDGTVLECPQ